MIKFFERWICCSVWLRKINWNWKPDALLDCCFRIWHVKKISIQKLTSWKQNSWKVHSQLNFLFENCFPLHFSSQNHTCEEDTKLRNMTSLYCKKLQNSFSESKDFVKTWFVKKTNFFRNLMHFKAIDSKFDAFCKTQIKLWHKKNFLIANLTLCWNFYSNRFTEIFSFENQPF